MSQNQGFPKPVTGWLEVLGKPTHRSTNCAALLYFSFQPQVTFGIILNEFQRNCASSVLWHMGCGMVPEGSCVSVAGPQGPDVWSNRALDVSVQEFCG